MRKYAITGLLIVSIFSMGFTGVALADTSGDSECESLFSLCNTEKSQDAFKGMVTGSIDNYTYHISNLVTDDHRTAQDASESFQDEFNMRNGSFVETYNERLFSPFEGKDTIEIKFIDESDDTSAKYLKSEHENGELMSAEIVDEIEGEPDEKLEITGLALENIDEEIVGFHESYVEQDELVDMEYISNFNYKYMSHIDGSFDPRQEYIEEEYL